jgi:hypothetical protein
MRIERKKRLRKKQEKRRKLKKLFQKTKRLD